MSDDPMKKPKLIIDEDWKSQVEREREELRRQEEVGESASTTDASTERTADDDGQSQAFPPANFRMLVSTLATQALAALGQFLDNDGKPTPVDLDYARHAIDLLAVLEEKTRGNLDHEEERELGEMLQQMRMLYVSVSNQPR